MKLMMDKDIKDFFVKTSINFEMECPDTNKKIVFPSVITNVMANFQCPKCGFGICEIGSGIMPGSIVKSVWCKNRKNKAGWVAPEWAGKIDVNKYYIILEPCDQCEYEFPPCPVVEVEKAMEE